MVMVVMVVAYRLYRRKRRYLPAVPADAGYFEGLRDRVRKAAAKA